MRLFGKPGLILVIALAAGAIVALLPVRFLPPLGPNTESIWGNLGTELIGSVITFLLLNHYLPRVINVQGSGDDRFSYAEFARDVRRSRKKVRILTTFVYPLTTHEEYRGDKKTLIDALNDVQLRNPRIQIQILILDPTSEAATQRSEERRDDDVIARIRENLSKLNELRNDELFRDAFRKIEVRLFDRLPPFAFFQWDSHASMSNYPRYKKITEAPRFNFSMSTPLGRFMDAIFDDVWTDPKTKVLDEYIYLPLQTSDGGARQLFPVHYVEAGGAYHVLLSERNADLASRLATLPPPGLEIVRNGTALPCRWFDSGATDEITSIARAKYGAWVYLRVITLEAAAR